MIFLIGLAFLINWLLIVVFGLVPEKATLVTGLIFLIIGALFEWKPWTRA